MSMLDGFFAKGFKAAKCKTLLKLTIPRIKLLRNRREIQLKQMRKDIAKLLENGQEATARIRVEHIIREENMMAAQEILELFCELITVRLPIIEAQKECPLDLKEAISSICFAAPRFADLPELQQVQLLFLAKYGKEFVSAATELRPDCGVNRQIIELLSIRPPSVETKMKLLKEIAEEHELDWDPSASEAEFLKPHEDLLNGPGNFSSGSLLPLPKEKHDVAVSSDHVAESHADQDFDSLDLPEVPKESVRASDIPSAPGIVSNLQTPVLHDIGHNPEVAKSAKSNEDFHHIPSARLGKHEQDPSVSASYSNPKQFIPFVNPPLAYSSDSEILKQSEAARAPAVSSDDRADTIHLPTIPAFSTYSSQIEPNSASTVPPPPLPDKEREQVISPPMSRAPGDSGVDLQDVLVAAKAAAETAERAASAARAAASLAEVKITDMLAKMKSVPSQSSGDRENQPSYTCDKTKFDKQESFNSSIEDDTSSHGLRQKFGSSKLFSDEVPDMESETSRAQNKNHHPADLPQRLPSFEDDPYSTFPNLFGSRSSKFDEDLNHDSPIHNLSFNYRSTRDL